MGIPNCPNRLDALPANVHEKNYGMYGSCGFYRLMAQSIDQNRQSNLTQRYREGWLIAPYPGLYPPFVFAFACASAMSYKRW